MKRFRLLLFAVAAIAVVLVVALAVAFSSAFQTWAVRKVLASQPALRAEVGSVSAGFREVKLNDVRLERDGAVLTLPTLEANLGVISAVLGRNVSVSRVTANGWTLDLSQTTATANAPVTMSPSNATAPTSAETPSTPPAAATADAVRQVFAGVFAELELPIDVAIDGVRLEGDVVLPDSRGRVHVVVTGGGLAANREGSFNLVANAALADRKVSEADLRGEIVAAMDTPRTFTRFVAKLGVNARGTQFPNGVGLTADISATRAPGGETYAIAVANRQGEIVDVRGELPRGSGRLDGTWKIDVRDRDLAPLALGRPLPTFAAVGEGTFDADATFSAVHVLGRLNASAARLEAIQPEFAALGELNLTGEFDVAERGGVFSVQKLEAAVSAAEPVATIRTLQPFEFNPAAGELRATDTAREVLGVVLHGMPLAWVKPFFAELDLQGGSLRGEFVATPRGGGVTVRSTAPLTSTGIAIDESGKPLLRDADLALNVSGDYTPQGWQAELSQLTVKSANAILLTLDAKAGQLAGKAQPLKATGRLVAQVPAILAQPVAANSVVLTSGEAAVDFVASVDTKTEIEAKVALKNLATIAGRESVALPSISADLRADLAADGTIAFNVPLVLERDARKSDLTIAGTLAPRKDHARAIDAHVTSTQLIVDDAEAFAGIMASDTTKPEAPANAPAGPSPSTEATPAASPAPAGPPWAGWHGSIALQLERVIYGDTFEMNDVGGRIRVDAGMLKLETLQAGLGKTGRATMSGAVTFDGKAASPFGFQGELQVHDFDPGPLLRAFNGNQPPTIEGKFDITSKLATRASSLGSLASGAGGEFHVTSRGGVFRGLPVSVGNLVESTSRLASWLATASTAISAMTGRKDDAEVANKTQAVAELAKGINAITYDQLNVVLTRDAALNTSVKDFTLIAPEVRLAGSGTILHRDGGNLLSNSLAMEYTLRARGRPADLLKYLGAIESEHDELGYAACSFSLRIGGSLGAPDSSEVNNRFAALALEKTGIGRIFGNGK